MAKAAVATQEGAVGTQDSGNSKWRTIGKLCRDKGTPRQREFLVVDTSLPKSDWEKHGLFIQNCKQFLEGVSTPIVVLSQLTPRDHDLIEVAA